MDRAHSSADIMSTGKMLELLREWGVSKQYLNTLKRKRRPVENLYQWVLRGHSKDPSGIDTIQSRVNYYNSLCYTWLERRETVRGHTGRITRIVPIVNSNWYGSCMYLTVAYESQRGTAKVSLTEFSES
jgi:hypothetical protein